MKKVLKRVLSILLTICLVFSSGVVGFAAGAVAGKIFIAIGGYLVGKLADYVWDEATGPEAQAKYEADKVAVLSVIRDWCVENNYDPNNAEFQQFIVDMYIEAPDNDEMTSRYGAEWGTLHGQVHPYFAKLQSLYQCGWEEAYNWIVEHYDDDITKLKPDGTVQIPSGDLVEFIDQQNTTNTPKGKDLFVQSYRSDSFTHSQTTTSSVYLFQDSSESQFKELFLIPFNVDSSGVSFYSDFQIHLYYKENDDPNSDIALWIDFYKFVPSIGYVLQSALTKVVGEYLSYGLPFCYAVRGSSSDLNISACSLEDYSNHTYNTLIKLDCDTALSLYDSNGNLRKYRAFEANYKDVGSDCLDYGFICSSDMISRTYSDIDTSKIPPNQIINITGDTIYDYSITNPDTGASTTINEYVTNNYYYPEVPSTSEPSGGGVGGNVNVGGNINVGGEVGVDITVSVPDININVNQSSGAGGSGTNINPDDILDGSSVALDKYYDDAVSQASGVRSFLAHFFDFLPAEIVGLICLLVAVAIVCRIFGR